MCEDPVLLRIGPLTVYWYGLFMAVAFLLGFLNWVWQGRRDGRGFEPCADLLFWIIVGGLLGARGAYVLSDLPSFLREPATILRVDQGGLIYYGGFAGAAAALALYARRRREPLLPLGDFVLTSLPLGHAVGRIGCFVNGCCYGARHDGFPAVTYPANSAPWWAQVYEQAITRYEPRSLPLHPVQLYEAGFDLLLYAVLAVLYRRGRRRPGRVAAVYLLLYPAWRFWAETFRGDERIRWHGLSVAQILSMALFLCGCALFWRTRSRPDATV